MEKSLLIKALKLSHVPRWVIIDILKSQTVSDHVYRTQILAVQLMEKLNLPLEKESVIYAILFHDVEEGETGDIPSTHKSANKAHLEASGTLQHAVLRLADTLEAIIWLMRYGVKPHRVHRYLEAKMIFLEEEISAFSGINQSLIAETTTNLIATGIGYD